MVGWVDNGRGMRKVGREVERILGSDEEVEADIGSKGGCWMLRKQKTT